MSSKLLLELSRPALRLTTRPCLQTRAIIIYEKPNRDDKYKAPDGLWWHPTFAVLKQEGRSMEEIKAIFDAVKKDNEKLAAQHVRKESEKRAKQRATKKCEEEAEGIYEEENWKAAGKGGG